MLAEAIYKGATRPAMKLGIPLVPLVVLFGGGMLVIANKREAQCTNCQETFLLEAIVPEMAE